MDNCPWLSKSIKKNVKKMIFFYIWLFDKKYKKNQI